MNDTEYLMSTREAYGHTFIANLVLGNTTTCVYHFIFDK